jgi:hypothetical protein
MVCLTAHGTVMTQDRSDFKRANEPWTLARDIGMAGPNTQNGSLTPGSAPW